MMRPPPLRPHRRRGGMREQERRAQIDGQLAIPIRGGELIERLGDVERRHVDQDVEASELTHRRVDRVDARLLVGDVGLHAERAAAERADRGGGFIRFGTRAVVDQRDIDARLRERRRDDGADALAAGDQHAP